MRHSLSNYGGWLFDRLESGWDSAAGLRRSAFFLVVFFVSSIILIELNRQGWLPAATGELVPRNHLVAIEWAFTMLLILEVVGLTLALSKSITISVGKQLEILSLILLRNTFKEISHLEEPLLWQQVEPALLPMISSALGALVIFAVLGFYYRIRRSYYPGGDRIVDKTSFILAKKNLALLLLTGFAVIVFHDIGDYFLHGSPESIFEKFYTLLVFSDVLLVLLSLRYSRGYLVAFRNSGFAVVTVMLRLALISPPLIGALLGGGTALFALAIIYAYTVFSAWPAGEEQSRLSRP